MIHFGNAEDESHDVALSCGITLHEMLIGWTLRGVDRSCNGALEIVEMTDSMSVVVSARVRGHGIGYIERDTAILALIDV